jgi:hypothetical protein
MCGFASAKRGKTHLADLVASGEFDVQPSDVPVVVMVAYGGDRRKFKGPWNEGNFSAWIHENKLPPVSVLSGMNFDDVIDAGRVAVLAVTNPDNQAAYIQPLYPLANQNPHLAFASVDGAQYSHYLAQFGVSTDNLPTIFALDFANERYYKPDSEEKTSEGVNTFVKRLVAGSINPIDMVAWYNPAKYFSKLEKWLSRFDELTVAVGMVVFLLSFLGLIFVCSIYCCGVEEEVEVMRTKQRTRPPADDGHVKAE